MFNHDPDHDRVIGYAEIALLVLRQNGISDDEIRAGYLCAHPEADRGFEASQLPDFGRVVAPAKAVKLEMERLLGN